MLGFLYQSTQMSLRLAPEGNSPKESTKTSNHHIHPAQHQAALENQSAQKPIRPNRNQHLAIHGCGMLPIVDGYKGGSNVSDKKKYAKGSKDACKADSPAPDESKGQPSFANRPEGWQTCCSICTPWFSPTHPYQVGRPKVREATYPLHLQGTMVAK
jgi:hypothetical protein